VVSSTKLEKRTEQVPPGSEGSGRRERRQGREWDEGEGWRNGPNNVCTYK
jgi:hypothetical protein